MFKFYCDVVAVFWLVALGCVATEVDLAWRASSSGDSSSSSIINTYCSTNADCKFNNTYCSIVSPTCGRGVCLCTPGFILTSDGQNCKPAVYGLGAKCDARTQVCASQNAVCDAEIGKCICPQYTHVEGYDDDCIIATKTKTGGQVCADSADCHYSLACMDFKCDCYEGYKRKSKSQCIKKSLKDSCTTDRDCRFVPNSQCKNSTCDCVTGYQTSPYVAGYQGVGAKRTATIVQVCVSSTKDLKGEGSACTPIDDSYVEEPTAEMSSSQQSHKPQAYCAYPLVCKSCGQADRNTPANYICVRDQPALNNSPKLLAAPIIIFSLIFSAI